MSGYSSLPFFQLCPVPFRSSGFLLLIGFCTFSLAWSLAIEILRMLEKGSLLRLCLQLISSLLVTTPCPFSQANVLYTHNHRLNAECLFFHFLSTVSRYVLLCRGKRGGLPSSCFAGCKEHQARGEAGSQEGRTGL